jgi:putative hemolysin
MHIVEQLIAERAPKLMSRPSLFKAVRPLLYRMLAYDAAVFLADAIKDKTGHEAFKLVTKHISPRTAVQDLTHLPKSGRCILISNHPTGLADGMAVFQAIRERRPDHVFLANADALRVMPKARDLIIPVEWVKDKRSSAKTRRTLIDIKAALEAEKCVVIFPSGRLAKMTWRGLIDKEWESSAAMLARKYKAPVIPLQMQARNSWLYYLFSWTSPELRDITLFHELLNKKGQTFSLTFGEKIDPKTLPKNADQASAMIRAVVEAL